MGILTGVGFLHFPYKTLFWGVGVDENMILSLV